MGTPEIDLIERALAFARWAYCANDDRDLEHPGDTAALLAMCGFPDTVVAAGLLHDVVEDTAATPRDVAGSVDRHVAELVGILSEDPTIASFDERKADLRRRVREAGGEAPRSSPLTSSRGSAACARVGAASLTRSSSTTSRR